MISAIHTRDARELDRLIEGQIVDVTITSPPYFDMKDYGTERQIGFGQDYESYLSDLKEVFRNVRDVTRDSGSLWVIIDSFKRNGQLVPLPFDFVRELQECGWLLQDVIIWAKDRTVPWTQKGKMRGLFEYILVFSKTAKFTFDIDRVRSHDDIKKWWVRYPERYNPNGKSPEGIWDFNIPVQGSWGNGYIRHFCPLPEELIEQILRITTREGDVVLDPFAGSGAVLSKAHAMKRKYIGLEINEQFVEMFKKYLDRTGEQKRARYEEQETRLNNERRKGLAKTIRELRALKFAKLLTKKVELELGSTLVERVYVDIVNRKPSSKHALIKVNYKLLLGSGVDRKNVLQVINQLCERPPLSKFGIEPDFSLHNELALFEGDIRHKFVWVYTLTCTHKFVDHVRVEAVKELPATERIISGVKVNIDETDYE